MANDIKPQFLFATICKHMATRDDLWHIVNGPKRETWFNAETIAALSRDSSRELPTGFRVYGEESYASLAAILDEFSIEHATVTKSKSDGWRRIPDITVLENCCNHDPLYLTIIEAKLISPTSTKPDGAVEMTSDLDDQLKALDNTTKCDGLLDQLDRAARLFPSANVFGFVFAVHRLGQCEQVKPERFFGELTSGIISLYGKTDWQLWKNQVFPIENCQNIKPLGGMFSGQASLGLGILERAFKPSCASDSTVGDSSP